MPSIAASSHLPPVRPLLRRWSHWAVLPPPCLGLCSASFLPCFSLRSQSSQPGLAQSHVTPLSKRMTLLPPICQLPSSMVTLWGLSAPQIPLHSRESSYYLFSPSFLPGNTHQTLLPGLLTLLLSHLHILRDLHIINRLLSTESFPLICHN